MTGGSPGSGDVRGDRAAGRQTRAAMRGRGEKGGRAERRGPEAAEGGRGENQGDVRNLATAGNLRKLAARRAEASG